MNSETKPNLEIYRLVVTRRNASEILLVATGSGWSLPPAEISHARRIAEQLCSELHVRCGYRGYCLLVPTLADGVRCSAVMEVPDLGGAAFAGTCWKPFDAAIDSSLESAEDRRITRESLDQFDAYRRELDWGPFARPGWLNELVEWAREQLDRVQIRLTGSFTQHNSSPTFSLVRLETSDSAVWFKATGEPNRHELPITICLARLFPESVPELLGVHAAWNGWLMCEAPGKTLDEVPTFSSWLRTAEELAHLQIRSVEKQAELVECGCMDLTVPRLITEIDPFIDRMRASMAAQQKQTPARLTDTELTLLGIRLKEACSRLSEVGLPDTLGHIDFNPGNIMVSGSRCVFLDWAEACVAHPLITFEYLREHFRRCRTQDLAAREDLFGAYRRPWRSLVSADTLMEASRYAPLVAAFAYAVGAVRSAGAIDTPQFAGYFRSLARRMFREAGQLQDRSEPCRA